MAESNCVHHPDHENRIKTQEDWAIRHEKANEEARERLYKAIAEGDEKLTKAIEAIKNGLMEDVKSRVPVWLMWTVGGLLSLCTALIVASVKGR